MIRQEFDWSTLTSAGQTPSLVVTSTMIAVEPVRRIPSQFAMLIGMFISSCCSTWCKSTFRPAWKAVTSRWRIVLSAFRVGPSHLCLRVPIAHFIEWLECQWVRFLQSISEFDRGVHQPFFNKGVQLWLSKLFRAKKGLLYFRSCDVFSCNTVTRFRHTGFWPNLTLIWHILCRLLGESRPTYIPNTETQYITFPFHIRGIGIIFYGYWQHSYWP